GGEGARRIEPPRREISPALVRQDQAVGLVVPEDVQPLTLVVVVRAREPDDRRLAGLGRRDDLLHEPSPGPDLDEFPWFRHAFGKRLRQHHTARGAHPRPLQVRNSAISRTAIMTPSAVWGRRCSGARGLLAAGSGFNGSRRISLCVHVPSAFRTFVLTYRLTENSPPSAGSVDPRCQTRTSLPCRLPVRSARKRHQDLLGMVGCMERPSARATK